MIGVENFESLKYPFFAHSDDCKEQSPSYADIQLALERNKDLRLKFYQKADDVPPPLDSMDEINSTSPDSLLGPGLSHEFVFFFFFQEIIVT